MKQSVRILWKVFFYGLGLFILILLCANFGLFGKMPSITDLENPEADLASEVYSSDGKLMGKYYSENRSEVKYSQISKNVIDALIATEDERFQSHSGIDARAIARAVFSLGTAGGGSTITQQLAKMMLNQGKGNVLTRSVQKLKEWIVAVKLERNFTKEEIITLYLNRASWGSNYGIRNASKTYYQKEPKDLNIEEAAVLVGMLKGFIYEPIRHKDASKARRNVVIDQMANAGYLTQQKAAELKALPLITNYKKPDENVGIAPYFRVVLAEKLREWCKTHKNPKTGENYDLYRDGLKIHTTINSVMQEYAEDAVNKHMPVIQKKLDYVLKFNGDKLWKGREEILESAMKNSERWKAMKEDEIDTAQIRSSFFTPVKMKVFAWNDEREKDTVMTPYDSIKYHKQILQTSFVAMDPLNGEIKCWVGGIDFKWFKYDHVTANRQVGSTFKPLLYTLAVQDAGYTPQTPIAGGSITLGGKTITGGGGTMAYCLAQSKNAAAYRLMQIIGVSKTIEFAQNCGITVKIPPYPSIALGSAEIPMLQMLRAYTIFPNKGFNSEPVFISRIEDKNGNLLQDFQSEIKQVISESDAYTMVKLMQGVVQSGTARSLNGYGINCQMAGKTGTTNGNTDGWFIGYTPELLAGTWVGCDDPFIRIYSGTSGGNEMALPKWGYFMNKVYNNHKLPYGRVTEFEQPIEMNNDPIYADQNFANIVNQGDGTNLPDDVGNGDANDFIEPPAGSDYQDVMIPEADKSKGSTTPIEQPKDNKKGGQTPAAVMPDKKVTNQPKAKSSSNDY